MLLRLSNLLDKPNKLNLQVCDRDCSGFPKDPDAYRQILNQQIGYKLKQLIDRSFANGYDWCLLKNSIQTESMFINRAEIGQLFEQIEFHRQLLLSKRREKIIGQDSCLQEVKQKLLASLWQDRHSPILLQVGTRHSLMLG